MPEIAPNGRITPETSARDQANYFRPRNNYQGGQVPHFAGGTKSKHLNLFDFSLLNADTATQNAITACNRAIRLIPHSL